MLKIVGIKAMQAIDQAAIDQYGIPGPVLMERAGRSLAERAKRYLPDDPRARVVILAGGGKNGGDGLVCAHCLAEANINVSVLLLAGKRMAPETSANLERLAQKKIPVLRCEAQFPEEWIERFLDADLVVDALLGIGLKGEPSEPAASAILALNSTGTKVLAADVPSGLNADTGEMAPATVRADCTLTFGLPKWGLLQPHAAPAVGQLEVDTLGFPQALLSSPGDDDVYMDGKSAAALLPRRPVDAHKRSAGKVLIVGGSAQYHGAVVLAAQGASRAGAGYVALAYPQSLDATLRQWILEPIGYPVPDKTRIRTVLDLAQDQDAVVLGPGLGRKPGTQQWVVSLLRQIRGPRAIVVDADALHALSELRSRPARTSAGPEFILTPHEGEAAQLLGTTAEEIRRSRWTAARELARRYQACVLLKGQHTVVASPQAHVWVIGAGTQALATAGTGDVLSGVLAAMVAQNLHPQPAAALAAYLHGLAGSLASPDPGGLGACAHDVAEKLPHAIRQLRLMPKDRPVY